MEVKVEGRYQYDGPLELLDRLKLFLAKIDYKPGWEWVLNAVAQDIAMIGVRFPITDVVTGLPSMLVYFHRHQLFSYDLGGKVLVDEYLLHVAHDTIRGAEQHEQDEWFKFNGVKIYDPHREGA